MCGCEEKGGKGRFWFLNIKFLDVSSRLFPLHVLFMETTPLTPGSIFLIKIHYFIDLYRRVVLCAVPVSFIAGHIKLGF